MRTLFDGMMLAFPNTVNRLWPNADIVHYPEFESAIVKVQNQKLGELSDSEKNSIVALLLVDSQNSVPESVIETTVAYRLLKKRKLSCDRTAYIDSRFLGTISNVCERMFSEAGYVVSSRKKILHLI